MKKIFLLIIIVLNSICLFAHNGVIVGKVIDANSNLKIENAMLIITSLTATTFTDEAGGFMLADIPENTYQIQISKLGFVSQTKTIQVKNYEKTIVFFQLIPIPIALPEVSISSNLNQNKNGIQRINVARIPINSAQDMLRTVPGLFIAQHAGGGKAEQIFLRGFDCDHGTDIALAVDGMPVNMVSHAHGQGYADLHFVIPEMVDKIEVNKGTYQANVGNFSTAGNIQFTTKKYIDKSSITLEKGMFNNNRLLVMANLLSKKIEDNQNWIVAGEYNFNKGYFDNPMNLNRANLFTKFNKKINQQNQLMLQATYFNSFWNASGQIPDRLVQANVMSRFGSVDPTEGGNTSRINVSASLKTSFKNNSIMKHQLFYNRYHFNLFSNFTFYKNDIVNGDMIAQKEVRDIFGYNGSYEINHIKNRIQLQTIFGLQSRLDNVFNTELSNVKQRNIFIKPISFGNVHELNSAIYMDENIRLSNKLTVNLGLRYDVFYNQYTNKLLNAVQSKPLWTGNASPKASVSYTFNNSIQGFAMIGKSFHSNDTRVVVAQQGRQTLPAAYGSEVGAIVKPTSKIIINASLWQLRLQQEFVYVGDEAVVEAGDASQRVGIDIGIKYQLHKYLFADIDLNYAHGKYVNAPKEENKIPLAPKFTSIGGFTYNHPNGLQASLRYRHLANRPANESNTIIADGYTLLDAVATYKYKHFTFGASIENVLNTVWKEAQFETETQLKNEAKPVTEIHSTYGTPMQLKVKVGYRF